MAKTQKDLYSNPKAKAILDAGISVFARDGLNATTRKIVQEANANIASIPYYFDSKDGLYLACIQYIVDQILEHLGSVLEECEAAIAKPLSKSEAIALYKTCLTGYVEFFLTNKDAQQWSLIISREHAQPTAGFTLFNEQYMQRAMGIMTKLMSICINEPEDSDKVIIKCHTMFGQCLVLLISKESLMLNLGVSEITDNHIVLVKEIIEQQVQRILTDAD